MMSNTTLIESVKAEFIKQGNPVDAQFQKAYMKDQYEFFGLKAKARRDIQTPFMKQCLEELKVSSDLIFELWDQPERDFHQFAIDVLVKNMKKVKESDIEVYEKLITIHSWWDTVDMLAAKLVGNYFKQFPEKIKHYVEKWLDSENIWLQRTAILFQLKY